MSDNQRLGDGGLAAFFICLLLIVFNSTLGCEGYFSLFKWFFGAISQ